MPRAERGQETYSNDIVDVGEVSGELLPVWALEDLDWVALRDLVSECEGCHVRATPGSINCEEAEARGGDIVDVVVNARQQLAGALRGSIQ
jgi:hypothetical protein